MCNFVKNLSLIGESHRVGVDTVSLGGGADLSWSVDDDISDEQETSEEERVEFVKGIWMVTSKNSSFSNFFFRLLYFF